MASIWIDTSSRVVAEGLQHLLEGPDMAVAVGPEPPEEVEIVVRDLQGQHPPFPAPYAVPTIALVNDRDSDKLLLLVQGYKGYFSGRETSSQLKEAVELVLGGQIWAERAVLSEFIGRHQDSSLTPRERQVLSLVADGLTNKQIAQQLGLAVNTVKVYVSSLLRKLDANNRTDLLLRFRNDRT